MHKKNYEQVIKVDELRANQKTELKLLKEERDLYKRQLDNRNKELNIYSYMLKECDKLTCSNKFYRENLSKQLDQHNELTAKNEILTGDN